VENFLYYIVTFSYLILPISFLVFRCSFRNTIPFILLCYGLLCFSFLFAYFQIPQSIEKYYQSIYTFLEYSFFTFIFWFNIRNKAFKVFMITASVLFFIFQIFFVTTTSSQRLDSIPIGIESILLFIYIFYFFYEFSKQVKDTFIYNHYTFWVGVGIMIYLGGSFFFYILINNLSSSEEKIFGNMTYVAEIIKNLLFAISIYLFKKNPVKSIQDQTKKIPNLDMNMI
jgi:hypothetical protein